MTVIAPRPPRERRAVPDRAVPDLAAHGHVAPDLDARELPRRLNWLRAGVLGANDGIVSTAALVIGFAGATANHGAVVIAGLVGLLAGALSMAAGEFVSVSAQ